MLLKGGPKTAKPDRMGAEPAERDDGSPVDQFTGPTRRVVALKKNKKRSSGLSEADERAARRGRRAEAAIPRLQRGKPLTYRLL